MINDRCEDKLLLERSRISYEELKKHSTYSDAWIAINGLVYDITDFIPKHPFGDTFRGSLGTDCSGLFSSAHIHTNVENLITNERFLKENGIKVVGHLDIGQDYLYKDNDSKYLDRIIYKKLCNDEFWLELKTKVHEYLIENNESTHYSTLEGTIYLLYYSIIFVLLSYLTWINFSAFSAVLLGFHMVCASAGMSHMVAHFGFTGNKLLNFVALHLMDLGGYSWLEWQIAHQTHHNQPHSSIDYQTNQYAPIRIHKYVEYNNHHKYQYIYFWIGILFYHSRIFPMSTIWMIKSREFVRHKYEVIAHISAKVVFLSLVTYCGYLHGVWNALILLTVYSISFSFFAFILLYNDHEENHNVLALNENVNLYHKKFSWAEVQVRTSGNWYPTNWLLAFVEFHYGYFNYHIEHHLFPAFKPSLLKKISPIVKHVCNKYDIPYISTSFLEVHKSFQEHIKKMGLPQNN
ncbi:MAG: fatty acid desaturase [Cyanobacteria bacterium P01_A01_bin.123]